MEAVQELIVSVLNSEGSIKDTRTLTLPGENSSAVLPDAQLAILGALNSLASREVCTYTMHVRIVY